MRVISGFARGTKLVSPQGMDVRPTLDRVKESVFSMLYGKIEGAIVLDLFAGTGALGIESLSRGAAECHFVDLSRKSLESVKFNLEKTRLSDKAVLFQKSAEDFLKCTSKNFDIVFVDPPYSKGIEFGALEGLLNCITQDSIVVLETEFCPNGFEKYKIVMQAKYGRVYITFLQKDNLL